MAHLKTRKLIRKFANLKNWMNYGCILLIEEANVVRLEINYHICYIRWIILNKFSDSCFRDFLKSANTFTYWSSVWVSGRNELRPPPRTTFAFLPGSLLSSCHVISFVTNAASSISFSHSQSLLAVWAYSAAGVAWLTRAVVTKPAANCCKQNLEWHS